MANKSPQVETKISRGHHFSLLIFVNDSFLFPSRKLIVHKRPFLLPPLPRSLYFLLVNLSFTNDDSFSLRRSVCSMHFAYSTEWTHLLKCICPPFYPSPRASNRLVQCTPTSPCQTASKRRGQILFAVLRSPPHWYDFLSPAIVLRGNLPLYVGRNHLEHSRSRSIRGLP